MEKIHDPRILAFMRRIKVAEDPALTARTGPSTVPTRLTAILADGTRVVREVDDVPGFVGRPLGRADIERKFRGNIGKRWPRERTDACAGGVVGARPYGGSVCAARHAVEWLSRAAAFSVSPWPPAGGRSPSMKPPSKD